MLHSRVFDREGHGFITVPDLQEVLQKLGEKLSTEECEVRSISVWPILEDHIFFSQELIDEGMGVKQTKNNIISSKHNCPITPFDVNFLFCLTFPKRTLMATVMLITKSSSQCCSR